MPPELLRAYLLGRGSEDKRASMEQRFFEDDAFEVLLAEAVADLLDDWARGRLSAADAALVQRRFAKSKRDMALALAKKTRKPSRRWLWVAMAAAALVILAVALSSRRPQQQPELIAELRLQQQATRGTNTPQYRPRAGARIRLSVPLIDGYTNYQLQIEPHPPQPAAVANGQVSAIFEIPDGRYELLVSAARTKGAVPELISVYPFELRRDVSQNSPLEK